MQEILELYGLTGARSIFYGTGLINNTWKITVTDSEQYILQRINDSVFLQPPDIAENIKRIGEYLSTHHPTYFFCRPLASTTGTEMVYIKGKGYYRVFPFVRDSHTEEIVKSPDQAYEAATQFGRFSRLLAEFEIKKLKITIPDFHNLVLRYQRFDEALQTGMPDRLPKATKLIKQLLSRRTIADEYLYITNDTGFKQRVTHHDTKISNVLFDRRNKGICVIDLDTVMPGYFISDVGDMMRTYLSPFNEEEKGTEGIIIRKDYYQAIYNGYMDEMKLVLSERERKYFFYSGKFMIYMQALRFLTDYLTGDFYYGANYEDQNLNRANNQAVLLERFIDKEKELKKI